MDGVREEIDFVDDNFRFRIYDVGDSKHLQLLINLWIEGILEKVEK